MKLLHCLSLLFFFLAFTVSAVKLAPEEDEIMDSSLDETGEKALSRGATSAASGNAIAKETGIIPSKVRYWGCASRYSYCGHRGPRCCDSLPCISNRCIPHPCLHRHASCHLGGIKCCAGLDCIHGACKTPKPTPSSTPTPSPTCSAHRCGPGHPRCCNGLNCISGRCSFCVAHHSPCGGRPFDHRREIRRVPYPPIGAPCCDGLRCTHGACKPVPTTPPPTTPPPTPTCTVGHCGPGHPRCCHGLPCIHNRCTSCLRVGSSCSLRGPSCCTGMNCIQGRCALGYFLVEPQILPP